MATVLDGDGVDEFSAANWILAEPVRDFSVMKRIVRPVVSGGRHASPSGNLGVSNAGLASRWNRKISRKCSTFKIITGRSFGVLATFDPTLVNFVCEQGANAMVSQHQTPAPSPEKPPENPMQTYRKAVAKVERHASAERFRGQTRAMQVSRNNSFHLNPSRT